MSDEGWSRTGAACLSATSPLSSNVKEEERAAAYERSICLNKKRRVGDDGRWTAAAAAAVAVATVSPLFSGRTGVYDGISTQNHHGDYPGMKFEEKGGAVQGWAKPGLGVCQLWAQQASSLKRKKSVAAAAVGDTHPASASSSSSSSSTIPTSASSGSRSPTSGSGPTTRTAPVAVGFGVDDPVPASREEKAKLVGGYLGTSRPGYGNEAMKREWWPAEVPWLKGMSISQMNNATLHTLVVAVKAHQRKERHQALADGADKLPDGLLVCAPKTKKEMSRLIRSIQGRRLQYGKSGKCPSWWPVASAPWDSERPLSTMKHGEVTSIFKAMVREGLLSEADGGVSCASLPPPPCPFPPPSTGPPGSKHEGENDRGETTSEERSDRHSSSGSSSSSSSGSGSGSDGNSGGVRGSGGGSTSLRRNGSRNTAGRDGGGSSGWASANSGRARWGGGGTGPSVSGVGGRGPLAASHLASYGNVKSTPSAGLPIPLHRDVGLCGPIPMPTSVSTSPSSARPASLLAMPGQQNHNPYQDQFLHRQREHYRQQRMQAPLLDAGGTTAGLHLGHFHPVRAGVAPGMPPPRPPLDSPSQVGSRNVSPAPTPYLIPSKLPGAGPPRLDELSAAWQDQLGLFDNGGGSGAIGYGGSGPYGAASAVITPTAHAPASGLLFSYGQPARSPGESRSASGPVGGAYCTGPPVDEDGDDHVFAAVGDDLTLDPLI